jgi:hypothetical protein
MPRYARPSNLTRNLPKVMVIDLVHHRKDGTLGAATYGCVVTWPA